MTGSTGSRVTAPFTPDQVASLNAFQASDVTHPFTCGNDLCPVAGGEHASLIAGEDGWHCWACDYTQNWAHSFMADMSWALSRVSVTVDGKPVAGSTGSGQPPGSA